MERQTRILEIVNENEKVGVTELATLLGTSKVTIRKDLDQLEKKGLLVRQHGYALSNIREDIHNRLGIHYEARRKIALEASKMVHDGDTLMIESGATCALFAEEITNRYNNLTIITNSVFLASHIRNTGDATIILLGGILQKGTQEMVGPLLKQSAKQFFVDKLFAGTEGFMPHIGFTGSNLMRIEAVRSMAESATEVVVLTDASKFNQPGTTPQFRFEEIHHVITDDTLSDDHLQLLNKRDIQVHIGQ